MLDQIKELIGSDGKKGWPVAVKDRVSYACGKDSELSDASVAVTFLWTMRDAIIPKLEKNNLAIATNFYTPAGLSGMVRNILANPNIRYIIMLGEEYSSKKKNNESKDLTAANAIRAFFEKGIDENRKVKGFESGVHFDKNIPTKFINKVREKVELIDLNKDMPGASFDDKIDKANELIKTLDKKGAFLEKPSCFDYEQMDESFPYEGGPIVVHGSNIPKTWIKVIRNIYRYGRKNLMNADTDRWIKEINNLVAVIHDPQDLDLSLNPFLVPLTKEKIEAYQKEIMSPLLPEGKAYTYGNKLRAYLYTNAKEIKELVETEEYKDFEFGKGPWIDANVKYKGEGCEINQVKDIIEVLKRDPYSKACVAMTWHVNDELMRKHKSSPCLALLQAMIQDEKLNLFVFFRSHDMTQGWPENAYGMAAIQKEISEGVGVETGELTIVSCSAQIYNNYYQQVEEMLKKYKDEAEFHDPRGNYLISIKEGKIIVTLVHPLTNEELEKYEGSDSLELREKISANGSLIDFYHALYLGSELAKAEACLKEGKEYKQE